jgi:hypothetical protein
VKVINADFIPTAGHGYLRVKRIIAWGLDVRPSPYSPMDAYDVYFEQDADATTFLSAAQEKGYTVKITEHPQYEAVDAYIEFLKG